MKFVSSNVGWIGGPDGSLMKTTDGGHTWASQQSNTSSVVNAIIPFNENLCWIAGYSAILWTTNGGSVGVDEENLLLSHRPRSHHLLQNYPNPFNPSTTIQFTVPKRGYVLLTVFNTLGEEVATLVNTEMSPGAHSSTWNAEGMASGIYFYQIQAGEFVQTKKLLLLR